MCAIFQPFQREKNELSFDVILWRLKNASQVVFTNGFPSYILRKKKKIILRTFLTVTKNQALES